MGRSYVESIMKRSKHILSETDLMKHAKFGQTGVPFPQDAPNEFAYIDFAKWAKKKSSKMKSQLKRLNEPNLGLKMMEAVTSIWTVWDKEFNNGAFSNIKDHKKFGLALIKMMHKDDLVFSKESHKIITVKEGPFDRMGFAGGKDFDKEAEHYIGLSIENLESTLAYLKGEHNMRDYDEADSKKIVMNAKKLFDAIDKFNKLVDRAPESKKGKIGFSRR